MGCLMIDGKAFQYEDIIFEMESPKPLNKEIAKRNLLLFKKILDNNSVKFLLMHGTLLGAIRNKDFIDWDCDIDTYVYDEQALKRIIPELYEAGLKLCRVSEIEYTFIKDDVYIDAFISHEHPRFFLKPFYCLYQFGLFPKKYFNKTQKIEFLGTQFDVTYKPERLLTYFYGKDWKTPKSDASSMNSTERAFLNNPFMLRIYRLYKQILYNFFNYGCSK